MVFCPVYRLEPETVMAIMGLEWPGPLTLHLQRDNPHQGGGRPTGIKNHLHQYQRGRDHFLRGDYDAMLVIESDVIPPPDALQRLAALEVDLAYGVYLFRVSKVVNVMERYKPWPVPVRNMGESLTVRGLFEQARAQGVIDCSGAGFGCVLIRRHVLADLPFDYDPADLSSFFDWQWAQDAHRAGYHMRADMAVLCGHKKENGEVLWPGLS